MTSPPMCGCGTFAIGVCLQCQAFVCDAHSVVEGAQRRCEQHRAIQWAAQVDPEIAKTEGFLTLLSPYGQPSDVSAAAFAYTGRFNEGYPAVALVLLPWGLLAFDRTERKRFTLRTWHEASNVSKVKARARVLRQLDVVLRTPKTTISYTLDHMARTKAEDFEQLWQQHHPAGSGSGPQRRPTT